jgi:ATP-dependent DNA helicase HFM1/MER3
MYIDRLLDQYPHHRPHARAQASSPPVGLHSSPAFKVSQRKLDQHVSQPQITRQAPSSSACLSYESAYDSKLEQRPNLTHASQQSKQPRFLSTHALPDRFRSIFPYPDFNAMQTRCFPTVYQNNSNFVLSSPTGSGKTVIFELAICHVINHFQAGQFKVVYQAPTKSLCAERQRDWQKKFRMFQLDCAELTGDTDPAQMRNVQSASIIITTPEKWDSVTRNWKDHAKLMNMIKLFLIDEVHMLHDERGATLEAVVSRMKSVHSDVRFIALSATVPNSSDIATWLGRDNGNQEEPAKEERFGEEFRPVLLQKHVAGYPHGGNEFSFEKMLDSKLPDVILRYSHRKPIMVFCFTRKSCESTARVLAQWWASKGPKDRYWQAPQRQIVVENKDLTRVLYPYRILA